MTPGKRGDRVVPSAEPGCRVLKYAGAEAVKGWEALVQQAPGNTWTAYETIRKDPQPFPQTPRHHRLKGALATANGMEQWQYEVTGGGRIWYLADPDTRTVWIRYAGTAHPKATD
jgi:hypothetical protein